jgi:transcription elongation GreA/GreB family factor
MKVERKRLLLEIISSEIESASHAAENAKGLAVEFADASFSQSGEREIYGIAAELAESTLHELQALREEVASASNETVTTAQPVCFVELDYDDGETEQCYLVSSVAKLQDITLITTQSAVGKTILGKGVGETATYTVSRGNKEIMISCKIVALE